MQSTALNLCVFMVLAMMACLKRISRNARPKLFHKLKNFGRAFLLDLSFHLTSYHFIVFSSIFSGILGLSGVSEGPPGIIRMTTVISTCNVCEYLYP